MWFGLQPIRMGHQSIRLAADNQQGPVVIFLWWQVLFLSPLFKMKKINLRKGQRIWPRLQLLCRGAKTEPRFYRPWSVLSAAVFQPALIRVYIPFSWKDLELLQVNTLLPLGSDLGLSDRDDFEINVFSINPSSLLRNCFSLSSRGGLFDGSLFKSL